MKITFFGTTTLLFDDGTDQILFDAHLTRPSMLRYALGKALTDEKTVDEILERYSIDRLKAVFVSHSHHDHVMDAPYIARRCNASVYGSSSTLNVARGGRIPEEKLVLYHNNETYQVGEYRIKVIPSLHSKPTVFNNDLGQTIDRPLVQPARFHDYKEGGSYDFYVEAEGKKYMIRPSFNYIEGQLDGYHADVLFLGVTLLSRADRNTLDAFFRETIGKVEPDTVIPIHWDNFFRPLSKPVRGMPRLIENSGKTFSIIEEYCKKRNIDFIKQLPGTVVEF